MNRSAVNFLLCAMTVFNILDGDLAQPSWLDIVKFALLAVCFILNNRRGKAGEKQ